MVDLSDVSNPLHVSLVYGSTILVRLVGHKEYFGVLGLVAGEGKDLDSVTVQTVQECTKLLSRMLAESVVQKVEISSVNLLATHAHRFETSNRQTYRSDLPCARWRFLRDGSRYRIVESSASRCPSVPSHIELGRVFGRCIKGSQ